MKDEGSVTDWPLPDLLGTDGLVQLLEMIEEERLPVKDMLEIIKRLHIPGYEYARPHFREALQDGVIENDVAPGYYRQAAIQKVIDAYCD